ncbi:exonuclease domain-containing protein [uncultured Muribaculum sp.]|uniref:exonuclease domain-containing protein n=1 Tax=uncultured Muribaculum sp. TaxID=1918613 RepID=UPI0025ECC9A9|nr:exonuclease domain-containing protein [uncultured Muribaculum sp.]
MNDFIAIDVETANNEPTSVCAIGAVLVKGGTVACTFYRLVKPEPDWYIRYFSTNIHGIYPADTENCPGFAAVWESMTEAFKPYGVDMETIPFVAHNKSFDERCIRACHRMYQMTWPDNPFFCTLSAARRSIRRADIGGSYSLPYVADYLGIPFKDHHNAQADALACAKIAMCLL